VQLINVQSNYIMHKLSIITLTSLQCSYTTAQCTAEMLQTMTNFVF